MSLTGCIILSIIGWWLFWYFIFYLRYEHKDTVNQLRSNLKEANKEIQYLNWELDEYTQQNTLLKQKTMELLDRNDELSDVVAELSKYYVHIKKASEKTSELNKFLQEPSDVIEEKIKKFSQKEDEDVSNDKIFF